MTYVQTENQPINPILRWAGSKKKLLRRGLLPFVPKSFNRYIEPFAGSACLFFALCPPNAILNDINPELMSFYDCVRRHPILTHRMATEYPRTRKQYVYLRSINPQTLNDIDRAARFFFLNRFCFNGLYRTNKNGVFNVPMGEKGKFPAIQEVLRAARALKKAELLNKDFEEVLSNIKSDDFIYLDPPYYAPQERRRNEYGNPCFTTNDFPRLIRLLRKINSIGATFVLSYSGDLVNRECLKNFFIHYISVRRSIGGFIHQRRFVSEIIVSNRCHYDQEKCCSL